ncbi:PVC-type heme-binding CxxCH protein [Luteitalea sp. TBR-22]|uniref:PVC-type heme-binding CxxCH protein n=1 Tax=Luteitalea sp. TBR-22 TaxID=2802971 RepID=UPI001EF4504B|nr:PVC-type heme-binding CxxCH protein [Luteitalea sp. TBR-22]
MTLMPILAAPLARKGIQLTHVATPAEALRPEVLANYDAIMIYANHTDITEAQEQALVSFVEGGKGLIALHCASFMFTKAPRYIPMIGGQFSTHGTGDFTAEIVAPDHPIMSGLAPFTTWDETYVHTRHNPVDRTVLMERVDDKGREPYTWVRTQGKGRVFYTAFGHDERTWRNPGFQVLVERATTWAVSDQARKAWQALKMPEVTYLDGFNVPNYEKRDPAPKYQMPFSPADSMKFITTPAEFDLQLFAREPDIVKPITFQFDARGRLWVIEAIDYPNLVLNGQPGADRIRILEDTNGDGRADKFTVFADRLNLATSLVFTGKGVIVAAAPHMLLLEDTNGDDKADKKTVLSTGWGISDSHAGPSNLLYGPDNYVWGTVGYAGFKGEMNGKPMQFGMGVFRFRPDGSGFEFVTGSTNNTWGLGFSETFDVFGSTANNDPSFYVAIPNRYFDGVEGLGTGGRPVSGPGYQSLAQFYNAHFITPYIRQVDVHGGYTAAAGHQLYTARRFPKAYWNRIAFITEPTAHIVGQGVIEKDGAGFVTRDGYNLMAGAEEWVAPVHAQVGPDGAVWVADWYNFIAQHNPTPPGYSNGPGNAYETSMRDRHHGRIYRIVPKAGSRPTMPRLSASLPASLVAGLSSDNMLWRLHAQRMLVERGATDVVPALIALTRNTSVDEIGLNGAALHAVWTLDGLGAITDVGSDAGRAVVAALKHPAAGVRKAAATVLATRPGGAQAILDAGLLRDPDLHTRLAAILALADAPSSDGIARAIYTASLEAQNFKDRWLSRALYVAAHRHRARVLPLYQADPNAVPETALPLPLRLGNNRPDWRVPEAASLASSWKEIEVPGRWESKGLADFDGVVWFTRTFDAAAGAPVRFSLGRIGQAAEVWVNGQAVPAPPRDPAAPAALPVFTVPAEALKAGSNVLTLRIQNYRGDGGFLSTPDLLYLEVAGARQSLAGTWRHRVERQTNAVSLYARAGELPAHLAAATAAAARTAPPAAALPRPDVTVALTVIPGQMKFDRAEFTVAPGQLVQLVFTNPDVMQHNFILGAADSLAQLGGAADQMLTTGDALAQSYVPQTSLVLFSTPIVNPGQTITVQFRAPAQAGDYPYVCTFPGHWRLMNGVMKVKN